MDAIAIDELDRIDEAFAGNRLLATFPREVRATIEPSASMVQLRAGGIIHASGSDVDSSYFPFGTAMVSLVVCLQRRSIEVASIGHEGAVGGIVSCGCAPAFAEARVLVGGPALKVPMAALEEGKMRSAHLRNLFCRFSDYLLAQTMQSVACNSFHPIEQRAARWLLTAQDRAGDSIELTQEALAGLLGVQRTTVNAVAQALQDEGLIATRRGSVRVLDRAGLKKRACECYEALQRHFAGTIGPTGTGGSTDCG